jgi:glutathione S-transferase
VARGSQRVRDRRRGRRWTCENGTRKNSSDKILEGDKPWTKKRLPLVADRVRDRLKQLSPRLGSADWLDGAFIAADLMMVSVLLRLRAPGILDEYPNLAAIRFVED